MYLLYNRREFLYDEFVKVILIQTCDDFRIAVLFFPRLVLIAVPKIEVGIADK